MKLFLNRFGFTILVMVIGFSMMTCSINDVDLGRGTNTTDNRPIFEATILEIRGDIITVEPSEGEDILRSADKIIFSKANLDDINASVRDIVIVKYTGDIRETYPAQITAVEWSIYQKSEA